MENLFDRHPLATLFGVTIAFAVALIALPTPDHDARAPESGAVTDTESADVAPATPAPQAAEPARPDPDSVH